MWWLIGFGLWTFGLRAQFIAGSWPEATLNFMPHGPFHGAAPIMASGFTGMSRLGELARDSKSEVSLSYLISEVTSHYFCCILLVRNQSLEM